MLPPDFSFFVDPKAERPTALFLRSVQLYRVLDSYQLFLYWIDLDGKLGILSIKIRVQDVDFQRLAATACLGLFLRQPMPVDIREEWMVLDFLNAMVHSKSILWIDLQQSLEQVLDVTLQDSRYDWLFHRDIGVHLYLILVVVGR